MDIFQDDTQQWGDRINAAVLVFREQMEITIEARNNVVQFQQIITQQANQIACLQAQGAGPSTAQRTSSTTYSKKVEIFNNPGEYNRSKVKFKEWWAKAQAWLKVNEYTIPAGSQDTISAVLSQLKGPKAGLFTQVHLTQAAQGSYTWAKLVNDVKGLFKTTNKKNWTRKELHELK